MSVDRVEARLLQEADAAGRERDAAEQRALMAAQVALYQAAEERDMNVPGSIPAGVIGRPLSDAVRAWVFAQVLASWTAARRASVGTSEEPAILRSPAPVDIDLYRGRDAWVSEATTLAVDRLEKLADSRVDRLADPRQPALPQSNGAWVRAVARTEATRLSAEATLEMSVQAFPGAPSLLEKTVKKMWVSRGDSRVRQLHRQLHGDPVKGVDTAFYSWGGGVQLRYPGDPLAPLDQVINCRCVLFMLPAEASMREVRHAFRPAGYEEAFDLGDALAASLRAPLLEPAHSSVAEDYAAVLSS